jgi:hypothetical protein
MENPRGRETAAAGLDERRVRALPLVQVDVPLEAEADADEAAGEDQDDAEVAEGVPPLRRPPRPVPDRHQHEAAGKQGQPAGEPGGVEDVAQAEPEEDRRQRRPVFLLEHLRRHVLQDEGAEHRREKD